jgi:hypothetical protein
MTEQELYEYLISGFGLQATTLECGACAEVAHDYVGEDLKDAEQAVMFRLGCVEDQS